MKSRFKYPGMLRYMTDLAGLIVVAWIALFLPCATVIMLASYAGCSLALSCLAVAAPLVLVVVLVRPLFSFFSPIWGVLSAIHCSMRSILRTT